jgi:MOSC domain-containing protein YiiM
MEQQGSVIVVPGVGIVGDRYALRTGTWSNPKWPDQELTLFAGEIAEAIGIEPYQARRNLVTQGIELSGLVGVRFRIGEALIAGVRQCDPCRYIQQLNAHPGLTKALAGFNGGLRACVIEGGKVSAGDAIEIVGLDG